MEMNSLQKKISSSSDLGVRIQNPPVSEEWYDDSWRWVDIAAISELHSDNEDDYFSEISVSRDRLIRNLFSFFLSADLPVRAVLGLDSSVFLH